MLKDDAEVKINGKVIATGLPALAIMCGIVLAIFFAGVLTGAAI